MKLVAIATLHFFHNRQQHTIYKNEIYRLDAFHPADEERTVTLKEFPGTHIPHDIFRSVNYKFGRETASRIEKLFPF
jgi:hypothetical protein